MSFQEIPTVRTSSFGTIVPGTCPKCDGYMYIDGEPKDPSFWIECGRQCGCIIPVLIGDEIVSVSAAIMQASLRALVAINTTYRDDPTYNGEWHSNQPPPRDAVVQSMDLLALQLNSILTNRKNDNAD